MSGNDVKIREFRAKQWAITEAEKRKLPASRKPSEEMPELPGKISNVGDSDLGDLHSCIVGWLAYAYGELALADIINTCAKRIKDFTESRIMLNPKVREEYGEKTTLLKAYSAIHKDTQKIIFEAELAYSLYALMKSKVAELEVMKEAASREITRRDAESRKRLLGT